MAPGIHSALREFLEDWIEYQEKQQTMTFKEDAYRGFPTFTERETSQHYAVTDDYVLFTTDPDLLEETIDRIEDGDSTGSLEESGRFQEARDAAPSARFSMLYVDSESIWRDIRRLAGGRLPPELTDRIDDCRSRVGHRNGLPNRQRGKIGGLVCHLGGRHRR